MIIPFKRRKPRFKGEYTRPPVILGGLNIYTLLAGFSEKYGEKGFINL